MRHYERRDIDFRIFKDVDSHEASYSAGFEIVAPGDTGHMMYIIEEGEVAVRLGDVTVEQIGEGGIFGEMGIVDPRPHTASVVALTDVRLYGVNQQQFLRLISSTPTFALRIMRILARRARAMNARLPEVPLASDEAWDADQLLEEGVPNSEPGLLRKSRLQLVG
ncbi:MAG: Crp/Fnr family transcriptional regulator [Hyphomicrobiaceae bacterium]